MPLTGNRGWRVKREKHFQVYQTYRRHWTKKTKQLFQCLYQLLVPTCFPGYRTTPRVYLDLLKHVNACCNMRSDCSEYSSRLKQAEDRVRFLLYWSKNRRAEPVRARSQQDLAGWNFWHLTDAFDTGSMTRWQATNCLVKLQWGIPLQARDKACLQIKSRDWIAAEIARQWAGIHRPNVCMKLRLLVP